MDADSAPDAPLDALTSEPVTIADARSSVLTPAGEVESIGAFARGLGRRRLGIALTVGGALVLLLALLATIA